jgi:trans-aconitate 2-methyltransferase
VTSFDGWDPSQYNQFATQREQPFWDLTRLIAWAPSPVVADLGCGDGRLSALLVDALEADSLVGVDSSSAMIEAAQSRENDRVRFERGDIGSWCRPGEFDVVFANASMQWVSDHAAVLARWTQSLRPHGQLAVQVPANADHPSHRLAVEVGAELLADPPPDAVAANVLAPESYAQVLDALGFTQQHVRLQVYAHHLESSAQVVEWVMGTTLTRFKEPLGEQGWADFVALYRARLLAEIGERSPYFYPFKRILLWARR